MHPFRTEGGESFTEHFRGCGKFACVDPPADRGDSPEIPDAPRQDANRSAEVAAAPVMKPHRDLDESFIEREIGGIRPGGGPEVLNGFMALEPLAAVELSDGAEEFRRGGFIALPQPCTPRTRIHGHLRLRSQYSRSREWPKDFLPPCNLVDFTASRTTTVRG